MPVAHREIPVKVTAWVDEGIADLVIALNEVPGVETLDSCQEGPDGLARVTFCAHENAALCHTAGHLADAIDSHAWASQVNLSLWGGCDDETLVADLVCPPSMVPALARAIRSNAGRMSLSAHGTACTAPRSWTVRRCHHASAPSHDDTEHPRHVA